MPTLSPNESGHSRLYPWVSLVLFLSLLLNNYNAHATGLSPQPSLASVTYNDKQQQLNISTVDQQWQLQLYAKQLLSNASSVHQAMLGLPQYFDADIDGDPEAWARFSYDNSTDIAVFSGHIFTQGQLFELAYQKNNHVYSLTPIIGRRVSTHGKQ